MTSCVLMISYSCREFELAAGIYCLLDNKCACLRCQQQRASMAVNGSQWQSMAVNGGQVQARLPHKLAAPNSRVQGRECPICC